MKFGTIPVAQAQGAILAHGTQIGSRRLPKGRLLDAADIAALQTAGIAEVIAATLDPGDLDENAAAAKLAHALAGNGVTISTAATGRVNLFADAAGIVNLDIGAINRVNAVNPMITVATLPQYTRVAAGNMVATIKIISYAVPGDDLAKVATADAVSLLRPLYRTATLIETSLGKDPGTKGQKSLAKRLSRLDMVLDDIVTVSHNTNTLASALQAVTGDVVFILTASATSDVDDIGPAALRTAGGNVIQFGMPVDPGNLLFLGDLHGKPVVGLPGCARSPALNGADWVLERVICGRPPSPADFAAMGVGGLLKEMPDRPQPRRSMT